MCRGLARRTCLLQLRAGLFVLPPVQAEYGLLGQLLRV
jgi:hypothetical protein